MAKAKPSKGLGKGLSALLTSAVDTNDIQKDKLEQIKLSEIVPNEEQPRKAFPEEKLEGLVESITENGVIQPLIVRQVRPGKYEIIAGERRWRAAKRIGLETVPAIVRDVDEVEKLRQALVENIVREDLNAIEEADAINDLIESHGLLQEDVAKVLGRSRSAITNTLRLRQLDDELKQMVIEQKLSAGHARTLLSIPDMGLRKTVAEQVIANGLSVRATETLVSRYLEPRPIKRAVSRESSHDVSIKDLETRLKRHFGTRVSVQDKKGKGKVVITYTSLDELDRLLDQWGLEGSR